MALYEVAHTKSSQLRSRAAAFTAAFSDLKSNPPEKILDEHFTLSPKITEHGPAWARKRLPFLGSTFSGRDACIEYFELLAKTLRFKPLEADAGGSFAGPKSFVVDPDAVGPHDRVDQWGNGCGVVSLVGKASFESVETGKSWQEQFIYRLSGFDEKGKIGYWEIWADPLSAWMAVGGEEVGSTD